MGASKPWMSVRSKALPGALAAEARVRRACASCLLPPPRLPTGDALSAVAQNTT